MLVVSGAINTIDRGALAIGNSMIRKDLGLSVAEMGLLLSAFLWAYAFSQLPIGVMIDRFLPRKVLAVAIIVWSVAQMLCGFVGNISQFFCLRIALGVGEAPQFPVAARVVRDWFNVRDRGLATGIFNSSANIGNAIAAPLLTGLMLFLGWRGMFITMGVAGIFLAIVWFCLYRDVEPDKLTPEENHYRTDGDPKNSAKGFAAAQWGILLKSSTTWGIILGFFGVIYQNWLFISWMPGYLEIERHMSIAHTGIAATIPYIFAVVGAIGGGWLADRLVSMGMSPLNSRKLLLCIAMLSGAASILIVAFVPSNTLAVTAISGVLFFGGIATTNAWGLVTIVAPANSTGSLASLQQSGGYFGGALAPAITGFIVQGTGSFVPALMVGACMSLLAAVAYFTLLRAPAVHVDPIEQAV
jgi:sugar phosphate permease